LTNRKSLQPADDPTTWINPRSRLFCLRRPQPGRGPEAHSEGAAMIPHVKPAPARVHAVKHIRQIVVNLVGCLKKHYSEKTFSSAQDLQAPSNWFGWLQDRQLPVPNFCCRVIATPPMRHCSPLGAEAVFSDREFHCLWPQLLRAEGSRKRQSIVARLHTLRRP